MRSASQRLGAVLLAVALAACGGGGGGSDSSPPPTSVAPQPNNAPPRATILASGDARTASTGVNVTLGGTVRLDAGTSADDDRDTLAYEWSLTARPNGSALVLPSSSTQILELKPDQLGAYTFQLKVSDPKGASSTQQLVVTVDNRAPAAAIVVTPTFTAIPATSPTQAVTIGASILIDGSESKDPDGDALNVSYDITAKPASSTAQLTLTSQSARLVADQAGIYKVRVRASDGRGGSFESNYVFDANNTAPNPVVVTTASPVVVDAGSSVVTTSVGYDVVVDASSSTDVDGDALQYSWKLLSKPAGSAVALAASTTARVQLSPDVLGDYTVQATVVDPRGATSVRSVTVRANNRRPLANIASNATPRALAAAPDLMVPPGTELTLRGDGSSDADGDTLTYAWTMESKPASSAAALSSTTAANPRFVADLAGSYALLLRVTDGAGAFSERRIIVNAGRHVPVAVVDKRQITTLIGGSVTASAGLSYDEDGDALTYQWALDARPAGSTAAVTATTAQMQFTPDMPGVYAASVTVRDGQSASVAYVSVLVLAQAASTVTLDYVPDDARYSVGLDKLVLVATNPNSLRILDPFTASQRSVVLPAGVKSFNLSNDGRLAVVLHEGAASLIDIATGTLIRTSSTSGSQTDAFVTNDGFIYMIGQTGGQWVDESVGVMNGRTGARVTQSGSTGFGYFYGTQYGVMAESIGKTFLMSQGLSPSDISYFTFNRTSNQVLQAGDSPYHGDYSMSTPLFLNEGQTLLFTSAGTYFRTDTLRYAGALSGVSFGVLSMSHAAASEELLVLSATTSGFYGSPTTYPTSYKRFSGGLLLPDTDLSFPLVNGAQSYGMKVFHTGTGRHVMLVQTGTATAKGAGAGYHVVLR